MLDKIVGLYNKIPDDKKGHITLGLLLGLAFGANIIVAVAAVMITAFGKELYDYLYNMFIADIHEVSIYDALATIVGGAIGISVVHLIKLVIERVL